MLKKLFAVYVSLLLIAILVLALPVFAIIDPSVITFGITAPPPPKYALFQNVYALGDWVIAAEPYIYYATTPNETADSAFSFQVIDTDGVSVNWSTPITNYNASIIGIYLTPAQASTMVWNASYTLRLAPNPGLFPIITEGTNQRTVGLIAGDNTTWYSGVTTDAGQTYLKVWCILRAKELGQYYFGDAYYFITTAAGSQYLNTAGQTIFLNGIPNLDTICPKLFQTSVTPIDLGTSNLTTPGGAYGSTVNITSTLGTTVGGAVGALATWWGMSVTMAGIIVLILFTLVIGGYAYGKTGSMLVPDAILVLMPIMGIGLGIIPMAIGFAAALFITILSMYYFFTRGVL